MRDRIWFWLNLDTRLQKAKMTVVWKLPRWVIELSTIRVWANSTTGEFSSIEPGTVSVEKAVQAWRCEKGGDGTFHQSEVSY